MTCFVCLTSGWGESNGKLCRLHELERREKEAALSPLEHLELRQRRLSLLGKS
jgi:hypothetical protein